MLRSSPVSGGSHRIVWGWSAVVRVWGWKGGSRPCLCRPKKQIRHGMLQNVRRFIYQKPAHLDLCLEKAAPKLIRMRTKGSRSAIQMLAKRLHKIASQNQRAHNLCNIEDKLSWIEQAFLFAQYQLINRYRTEQHSRMRFKHFLTWVRTIGMISL